METASARAALNAHTELLEVMNRPPEGLIHSADHYITAGGEFAGEVQRGDYPDMTAEERAIFRSWDHYTWPAKGGLDFLRMLAEPLSHGRTYQVTGEIVRAVTGMYQATGRADPVLRASEMPSPAGFLYLDESVTLADFSGMQIATRAFSWGPQTFSPEGCTRTKGVRVTSWAEGDAAKLRNGELGSSASVFVPYGSPLRSGISDDPTRWLHCLWLFMDTEIAIETQERADRSTRRRAERAGLRRGDVTVIMLPYRHYESGGGHRDVDWSCRWVVQGHDRHLGDYREAGYEVHHAKPPARRAPCATCGIKTTHVRSYVKGPDGLPLKSADKVFRVA
jgi:hypothetical protein